MEKGPAVASGGLGVLAGAVTLLQLAAAGAYGFHRDELYFGYVDQPPLTPLLAHALEVVFRGSLVGLRLPSALIGGAVVLITGLLAREFDAERGAQVLAAGCAAVRRRRPFPARARPSPLRPERVLVLGPPPDDAPAVIVVGYPEQQVRALFGRVDLAGRIDRAGRSGSPATAAHRGPSCGRSCDVSHDGRRDDPARDPAVGPATPDHVAGPAVTSQAPRGLRVDRPACEVATRALLG